jgi:membrane protease YdiL (CAAX protease family)
VCQKDQTSNFQAATKEVLSEERERLLPLWNWLAAIFLLVLSIVLIGICQLTAVGFYAFAKGVSFPSVERLQSDPTLILIALLAVVPAHLLTILLIYFFVTRGGRLPFWTTLGWSWNGFGFWNCAATATILFLLGAGIVYGFGDNDNEFTRLLQSSRAAAVATAAIATLTAPITEELVYRGVLFSASQNFFAWVTNSRRTAASVFGKAVDRTSKIGSVLFVTAVFALVHVPQYLPSYTTIFIILILSFALTMIRAVTDSLLPCFVIHTIFNGIQAVQLILEPYLPKTFAPNEPTVSAILRLFY